MTSLGSPEIATSHPGRPVETAAVVPAQRLWAELSPTADAAAILQRAMPKAARAWPRWRAQESYRATAADSRSATGKAGVIGNASATEKQQRAKALGMPGG